jgi:hypothetical protein
MVGKRFISSLSAAVALGFFTASTAAAAGPTAWPTGRPIIVTDLSNPSALAHSGRGIDIARIDGQIVS